MTREPVARAALVLALLAAGCAAPRVAPPTGPTVTQTPAPLPPGAEGPLKPSRAYVWTPALEDASRRLRSALGGEAEVAVTTDQRLWVRLPVEASFAARRSALTRSASGWLDQVAGALRQLPRAEVAIVAGADAGQRGPAAQTLALDRAASARDWLVARGVAAPRMSVAARPAGGGEPRLDLLIGERGDPR